MEGMSRLVLTSYLVISKQRWPGLASTHKVLQYLATFYYVLVFRLRGLRVAILNRGDIMPCYDIVSGYVQRALAWTSKPKHKVLQYLVMFYYVLLFMLRWLCPASLNRGDIMS